LDKASLIKGRQRFDWRPFFEVDSVKDADSIKDMDSSWKGIAVSAR